MHSELLVEIKRKLATLRDYLKTPIAYPLIN